MSVVKMRCNRVSTYDQGGNNLREVSLVSTDREGGALNEVAALTYANFSAVFVDPEGADIIHDALLDVTIAPTTPVIE